MAQVNISDGKVKHGVVDINNNPIFGVRTVGEGTSNVAAVIYFEVQGTTYYMWIDATGDLRVGTTEPTAGALTGTGTIVGTQS